MFALLPTRCYGDILEQNHKILLKNRQILEKMYNHCIFTSVLNPCKSSYGKCHRLSFLMSQTLFVCSVGHFEGKNHRFLTKICKTVTGQ